MNKLRKTIEATKLSNPELSIKLGHSRKYLTNLLNKGCSTAMQNQLIEEINQVMAGTFKTDAEVIAELTQRLVEEQDKYTELNNRAIGDMLDKNTEIEELQADFDEYLGKYDDCFTQLSQQKEENIDLKNKNESIMAVLGAENQELRKNAQNYDIVISEHQATITHLTAQLNQSREIISKLNSEIEISQLFVKDLKDENSKIPEISRMIDNVLSDRGNIENKLRSEKEKSLNLEKKLKKASFNVKITGLLSLVCLSIIILLIVTQWGV